MKRSMFIILFLFTHFQVNGQFSASLGYRHSIDGIDFKQNHFNAYARWEVPRNFQFSIGLEFTPKKLRYSSKEIDSDYSNGGPELFHSWSYTHYRSATVFYLHTNVGLFFDWALIKTSDFELYLGFYTQFGTTILKQEKDHETYTRFSESYTSPSESYTNSYTTDISYTEFNAINMTVANANVGLKLGSRYNFNQNYIQLDFSIGKTAQEMFNDARVTDCKYSNSKCFEYEYLFKQKEPLYFSVGISVGHKF